MSQCLGHQPHGTAALLPPSDFSETATQIPKKEDAHKGTPKGSLVTIPHGSSTPIARAVVRKAGGGETKNPTVTLTK